MVRIVLLAAGLFCGFGMLSAQEDQASAEPTTVVSSSVQPEAEDKQFDFEEFLKDLKKLESDAKEVGN